MSWSRVPLRQVAPPERAQVVFSQDEVVWQLQLDQIESQTGRILKKVRASAKEAGGSTFAFDTDHVLYSKLRPYLNKVVHPNEPGIATTELVPLRPVKGVLSPKFLTFYLRSDAFVGFASASVAGAKMPRVSMDHFWVHRVPLPTLREQGHIVELLTRADNLRQQRADTDVLTQRILPALFRKMFGNPNGNGCGWKSETLLNICSPKQWPTISSRELLPSGYPVYGANGRIGFYSSFNHEQRTVLITCRGATCGTINVCEPKSYVTGNAMALDDPDQTKTTIEFLEWFLRVRGLRDTITGAAQPQITRANLSVVDVPTPPMPLVLAFTANAQAVDKIVADQRCSRDALEKLFRAMLHRAFTGELTARWREGLMKELLEEMEIQSRYLASRTEATV